jgi:hypothetical protein
MPARVKRAPTIQVSLHKIPSQLYLVQAILICTKNPLTPRPQPRMRKPSQPAPQAQTAYAANAAVDVAVAVDAGANQAPREPAQQRQQRRQPQQPRQRARPFRQQPPQRINPPKTKRRRAPLLSPFLRRAAKRPSHSCASPTLRPPRRHFSPADAPAIPRCLRA